MLAGVFAVGLYHFGTMMRVIDFDAIQRYLGAYFVEQIYIVIGKVLFPATRMGDERDGPAAVCGIDRHCHVCMNRDKSCFADHAQSAMPVVHIAVLPQQADVVAREYHIAAVILQHLLLAWKLISFAA